MASTHVSQGEPYSGYVPAGRSHTAGTGNQANPRRRNMQAHIRNQDVMVAVSESNGNITAPDKQYNGPSYSVKYLGIVDGSMGVLSRKMALLNYNQARNLHAGVTTVPSTTVGGVRVLRPGQI